MFLFRSLPQVEPYQINRLSLVMNYHVKFGKHFTSRFHSSLVWCYIHVRYKKAAFKVKLYLYFKLTNVQTLCFSAHSRTIITRNIPPVQGAGMRVLKDDVTTVPFL